MTLDYTSQYKAIKHLTVNLFNLEGKIIGAISFYDYSDEFYSYLPFTY